MSTKAETDHLSSTLFGKTRRAVLSLLYTHAEEEFYLREIVKALGLGMGTVQREVEHLSRAGIIKRMVRGRHVYFQANPKCPIFEELKGLLVKTAGIGDVLRTALAPFANRIIVALIYGSFARGEERSGSDLDILVIGEVTFSEITSVIAKAQEDLRREINPTVYPPDEFRSKVKAGHHFLKTVLAGKKVFIMGDDRELERLAKKRLAH